MSRFALLSAFAAAFLFAGCTGSRHRGFGNDGAVLPRDSGPAGDAGSVDAGPRGDAGVFDAGGFDAGGFDAGSFDAGPRGDAGSVDAGTYDAGPPVGGYAPSAPSAATVPFIDACAAPGHTAFLPMTDDSEMAATLPFAFRYFGVLLPAGSPINVTTNGWIGMDGMTGHTLSGSVPSPSTPNAVIAPHWSDDYTGPTGICIATMGTAPNRTWVVAWPHSYYCCSPGPDLNYEVILHETTGVIDFAYDVMSMARDATMGIEDQTGAVGLNACPGGASTCTPTTGQRVRFTPTP